ncbi:MAG: glycosyltransferase family 10, partial [Saprospiraceae bacterium]|nr:glycosyltransferase family 10 [Saprospiraceae bacterium]
TFDFIEDPRHFRFPLFGLYCNPDELIINTEKKISLYEWKLKNKFCCIVVSNPNAKERIEFYTELSKYKTIDSGGKWNNNVEIGPSHIDKLNFIRNYKFVISFENSSYPGYTTEKIIEPLMINSIPIYWGNPLIEKDINLGRIINVHSYDSINDVIQEIIAIDNDDLLALEIVNAPIFNNNKIPDQINKSEMLKFLIKAVENNNMPVGQSIFGKMSIVICKILLWCRRMKNGLKHYWIIESNTKKS